MATLFPGLVGEFWRYRRETARLNNNSFPYSTESSCHSLTSAQIEAQTVQALHAELATHSHSTQAQQTSIIINKRHIAN